MLSPSHKLSDFNSADRNKSTPKKIDKLINIAENKISLMINEPNNKSVYNASELSTIKEKQTIMDIETSDDIIYVEENSSNNKNFEIFGQSYRTNDHSPILTIVDNEKLIFTRQKRRDSKDFKELLKNVYGNEGFEDDSTDAVKIDSSNHKQKRSKRIKHSYSLDLGGVSHEEKRRKFSIETKLESVSKRKSFLDSVVKKLFDQESKQDSIKTDLFASDENIYGQLDV